MQFGALKLGNGLEEARTVLKLSLHRQREMGYRAGDYMNIEHLTEKEKGKPVCISTLVTTAKR